MPQKPSVGSTLNVVDAFVNNVTCKNDQPVVKEPVTVCAAPQESTSKSNQNDCLTLTSASIPTQMIGTATFGSLQSVIVRRQEKWILFQD